MEAQCLIQAAATELAKHHSVEAIAIKAVEGKISVATIGRVSDASVAEQIQEALAKVQTDATAERCRLLQADPSCARCEPTACADPPTRIDHHGKRRRRHRGARPLSHARRSSGAGATFRCPKLSRARSAFPKMNPI